MSKNYKEWICSQLTHDIFDLFGKIIVLLDISVDKIKCGCRDVKSRIRRHDTIFSDTQSRKFKKQTQTSSQITIG